MTDLVRIGLLSCLVGFVWGCDDAADEAPTDGGPVDGAIADAGSQDEGLAPDAGPPMRGSVTHDFGEVTLDAFQERQPCVSWTLNNDAPLYVETVEFVSGGAFHHSNWFVVPESLYEGPDGFFRCSSRGFDELGSAAAGTVIFAQSTQSRYESQHLGAGVVIKIPPRHRIVAGTHLLNLSAGEVTTDLRLNLEVVHPSLVETIVAPFRFSYLDLHIPARQSSRFNIACDMATAYENRTGSPFDMKLYWVLPHMHELGSYFDVTVEGGAHDGLSLHGFDQFNAEANGKAFDPPIDLSGATGLSVTCGFNNPRAREVGWGVGDQEMCVMLGFADSKVMMDISVVTGSEIVDETAGVPTFSGPCAVITLPKNAAQSAPSAEELEGPLNIPASDPDPDGVRGAPTCVDTPADAAFEGEATLEAVRTQIFRPSCSFSACHGGGAPGSGLDLMSDGVRERLLASSRSNPALPLVDPGNADNSWLYQRLSECAPEGPSGVVAHMPLNAPVLLQPHLVALMRDWIQAGAPD